MTQSSESEGAMSDTRQLRDWWCPRCEAALSGGRVTHDERCDTCGTPVTVVGDSEVERLERDLSAAVRERDEARAELGRLRQLALQAAGMLKVFNGHDSRENLRHNYGEEWWIPVAALVKELRDAARMAG